MIKKIALLLMVIMVASCNSTKPIVRTSTKSKQTTTKKPMVYNASNKSKAASKSSKTKSNPKPADYKSREVQLDATSKVKTYDDEIKLYIANFQEIAKNNMKTHGIPASITLAQGILESGAGKGKLAQSANNHFGIKCHKGWVGESVRHDDDAAQECFRKYSHPSESYSDHSLFLTSRSRYANLFKLDKGDYEAWANGLKAAGYATDVKYPNKLIGIIERFELYEFDNEVLYFNYVREKKGTSETFSEETYTIQHGDTLYSLSKKFNISIEEIKQLNNFSENTISIGQKIKIK